MISFSLSAFAVTMSFPVLIIDWFSLQPIFGLPFCITICSARPTSPSQTVSSAWGWIHLCNRALQCGRWYWSQTNMIITIYLKANHLMPQFFRFSPIMPSHWIHFDKSSVFATFFQSCHTTMGDILSRLRLRTSKLSFHAHSLHFVVSNYQQTHMYAYRLSIFELISIYLASYTSYMRNTLITVYVWPWHRRSAAFGGWPTRNLTKGRRNTVAGSWITPHSTSIYLYIHACWKWTIQRSIRSRLDQLAIIYPHEQAG